ncbi:uncharacterized protein LOC131613038 [Vicia villosa]|uniref:uncharacterized protein LOC131613038 n=1 Tax=Vicia villosa TaxID=3911 RepID=UPI00273C12DA|nr:uncharacterized protein LOC131613038 [Vicia villosa]
MTNIIPSGGGGGSGGQNESLAERQSKINAACSSLVEIGFDPALFTLNMIQHQGLTETEFLEMMEPFSSIKNLAELRSLFDADRESLVGSFTDDFSKFIAFVNWVRGKKGKKSFDDVSRNKTPKGNKEFSKADVELAQMLVDYGAARTLEYKLIQSQIEKLKKRQMELEAEYLCIALDLKNKVGPLTTYTKIPIRLLRVHAHKLYLDDCTIKGKPAIPITDEMGFVKAVDEFGELARKNHFLKFLNDPIRKETIENFFKHMILRMKGGCQRLVLGDSGEPSNETENTVVHKFASDFLKEISDDEANSKRKGISDDEAESSRKRVRMGKQPMEEGEHGGD